MITLTTPPQAVIQGGLLDRVQVETFGIITLVVVALIVLAESVWAWLNEDKTQNSTAGNERRHPGSQVGVLYCDAGNAFGHHAGQVVRSTLAARIRDCLRAEDAVGQLKDDKLWVVLRGVHDVDDVVAVGNKIRRSVTGPIPYHLYTIDPTLNIGATLALPGESITDACNRAQLDQSG